jgi:hypothetical protein
MDVFSVSGSLGVSGRLFIVLRSRGWIRRHHVEKPRAAAGKQRKRTGCVHVTPFGAIGPCLFAADEARTNWGTHGARAIRTMRGWDQSERFDHAWALVAATYKCDVQVLANIVDITPKLPRKENRRAS